MATIEPYDTARGRRWRVRYRRPDRRQTDKRGFKTKRDAQAFAATVETSKLRGTYVSPSDERVTVGELGEAWLARQTHVKPSTLRRNTIAWQQQVRPEFGALPVSQVTHSHIRAWLSNLTGEVSASKMWAKCGQESLQETGPICTSCGHKKTPPAQGQTQAGGVLLYPLATAQRLTPMPTMTTSATVRRTRPSPVHAAWLMLHETARPHPMWLYRSAHRPAGPFLSGKLGRPAESEGRKAHQR